MSNETAPLVGPEFFHVCRLETETGHFVTATRVAYMTLPNAILWGQRIFFLYEAGHRGRASRYRERFWTAAVEVIDEDPLPQCEPAR